MKKFAVVIGIVLLAVLCVSLSACNNTTTVKSTVEKYGDIKSVSVAFELTSSYVGVHTEQAEIDKIVSYFDGKQFDLTNDLTEEEMPSITEYSMNILFVTSSVENSFSVDVCKDGTTYLKTKDGTYMLKGTLDVQSMKKFMRAV